MATNQEQVNTIARKFGISLINMGIKFVQSAFAGLKPKEISFSDLKTYCVSAGLDIPTNQFDYKYYLVSWETWQMLLDLVILDKALYIGEKRDCDNFAFLISGLASFLTGLNTCGAALGFVYNRNTGAPIAGHYFNIIVCSDGKLYCYDVLNSNGWCQIEKGKPIIIENWEYKIKNITFF